MAGGKDSSMTDFVSEDWSQLTPDILREVSGASILTLFRRALGLLQNVYRAKDP